ncbi:MAG: hypothetical protein ACQES9_06675 [Myxococcota bacterium]
MQTKLLFLTLSTFSILVLFSPVQASDKEDFVAYSPHVSMPLTTVTLGSWLIMEIFKKDMAPTDCTWCTDNKIDRLFMNNLQWGSSSQKTAHTLSNFALGSLGAFSLAQL